MLNIFGTKLNTYTSLQNQAVGQNYTVFAKKTVTLDNVR